MILVIGTVTGVTDGKAHVQFASEAAPRHLPLRAPKKQTPTVGDMAVCAHIGGAWLIIQIYDKE